MSDEIKTSPSVDWYRCPVDRETLKTLNERSNLRGLIQALGYLAVLVLSASAAWYVWHRWGILWSLPVIFLHGTFFAFQINAVHELGHNTVFRTRSINSVFEHLFAFLGWINHRAFWASHLRHHRYTLHPPDDLEVVLPVRLTLKDFLKSALINPWSLWWSIKYTTRIARGQFEGEWELKLFPAGDTESRKPIIAWARTLLAGHLAVLAISIYMHWWLLPVLTTFAPFYGGWLQFLCNNVQHVGLQDKVPDYRLCCRTIDLNPLARFLYWQMNYHTEHHMYPGVPCYRLGALHRAIEQDMPPTLNGLLPAWRQIQEIFRRQKENPAYRFVQPVPDRHATAAGRV